MMKSWLITTVLWALSLWAPSPNTITLDLASPTKANYSGFLTEIRNNVKDPKLFYGGTTIPVVAAPTGTYLRINLALSDGTVSLGLLRNDLYVVAYLAKNDKNKFRVYYFKSLVSSAQLDKLFPEAKGSANQQEIKEYGEDYKSLETASKISRKQAGLGIDKFVTFIGGVNGKARRVQDEARFVMNAVQMVSEAARFGHIENLVLDIFPNVFNPDDKVILLERNWKRISEAIKISNKGVFAEPLVLESPEVTTTWTVNNAAELNMGILKNLGKALPAEPSFEVNYGDQGSAEL